MSEVIRYCGSCKFAYASMKVPPCSDCRERNGIKRSMWEFDSNSPDARLTKGILFSTAKDSVEEPEFTGSDIERE